MTTKYYFVIRLQSVTYGMMQIGKAMPALTPPHRAHVSEATPYVPSTGTCAVSCSRASNVERHARRSTHNPTAVQRGIARGYTPHPRNAAETTCLRPHMSTETCQEYARASMFAPENGLCTLSGSQRHRPHVSMSTCRNDRA